MAQNNVKPKGTSEQQPAHNDNKPKEEKPKTKVLENWKSAFSEHFSLYLSRRAQATKALCQALALAQKLALDMLEDPSKHDKIATHLKDNDIAVTQATTVEHLALKALVPTEMHQKKGRCAKAYGGDRKRVSNWAAAIQGANDQGIEPKDLSAWIEKVGGLEAAKAYRIPDEPQVKVPSAQAARDYVSRKTKLNEEIIEIDLSRYAIRPGEYFIVYARKGAGHALDVIDAIKDPLLVNRASRIIFEKAAYKELKKRQANQDVVKCADNDDGEKEAE